MKKRAKGNGFKLPDAFHWYLETCEDTKEGQTKTTKREMNQADTQKKRAGRPPGTTWLRRGWLWKPNLMMPLTLSLRICQSLVWRVL